MRVLFPGHSPFVLFKAPIHREVVLYLQVYHCPYPFSFADADILKHTLSICTLKLTKADTYFPMVT